MMTNDQISLEFDAVGFMPRYPLLSASCERVAKPPTTTTRSAAAGRSTWTESEIRQLCWLILEESLVKLTSGRNRAVRDEEMERILSDDSEGFAFRTCAEACGMDPDELRVAILRVLND